MSIIGAAKDWAGVIDSKVPEIIRLVVAAWKRVSPGAPDEREDEITTRLCIALQRSRTARKMMFYIHYQAVELDPSTGDEFGRMDIAFYPSGGKWVPREDIYFCLECKRLNVIKDRNPRSYATEYITMGMSRFVSGQYARAVLHGGMIGYVRDGDVTRAMDNVATGVTGRHVELRMKPPGQFMPSAVVPRLAHARDTHHQRRRGEATFRLHHLFMADNPAHAPAPAAVPATPGKKRKRRQTGK